MFEKAQSYLLYSNHFCGIEMTTKNGEDIMFVPILKKTKNQLDIQESFEASSIEEISGKLPKNIAVYLVLNTDKILTKRIENEVSEPIRLVHKAFPNIDIKDFYYEVLVQDDGHFISICRKEYVVNILEEFQKANVSIVNLSFGSLVLSTVLDYIQGTSIFTYTNEIIYSGKTIQAINSSEATELFDYNLNGIKVSNTNILSLTGAMNLVLNRQVSFTNYEPEKSTLLSNFKQSRFFGQFLKTGLIFVFGLLLLNFLVFNHYFDKVQSLEQTSHINQNTKSQVVELNKKVEKSQKMVEDILNSNASKSSFYANEIILSLPATIVLSQLNYQPLLKRIKADQPILNEINIILISGESTSRELFSDWISALEHNDWVKKVEISDYTDVSNSLSNFEIKIILVDD